MYTDASFGVIDVESSCTGLFVRSEILTAVRMKGVPLGCDAV
jgi:hypothetical protein